METTDLMVGDWFRCSDPMPFKIESITKDDGYSIVVGDDGFEVCVGDLEPIPLTAEVLEKNGLLDIMHNECYVLYGKHNEECTFYCDTEFCTMGMDVKYVHELQHALRLCGLTELADNFKI